MINYNDCIFVCVCVFFPEFALQLLVALGIIYLCEENLATWYGVLSDSGKEDMGGDYVTATTVIWALLLELKESPPTL